MAGSTIALVLILGAMTMDEPVDLGLLLPDNAVVELRLEKKERVDGGDWETTHTAYRIEITPVDDDSYRTVWTDMDDPDGPRTVFLTDEALVPVRLEDHQAFVDQMALDIEKDSPGAQENAQVIAMFRAMSAETLTGLIAKDVILANYGQGTMMEVGEARTYQQPGGSFGDSGPLMMDASFLLESVNPEGTAVVVWTSEVDPAQAQKVLPQLLGDMMDSAGADDPARDEELSDALRSGRFVLRTQCRYQIDVETGIATSTECTSLQDITLAGETRSKETRLIATQVMID